MSLDTTDMQKMNQYPKFDPMRRMRHVHFVGIGGVGMRGIAEILLNLGYIVSGSDISVNATTRHLIQEGARVFQGHTAENIAGADVVVISAAIARDNPEIQGARQARIPVISRAEMLGELMRFRKGIAIAGTHGKTTTTSLIASVLAKGGLDPTFVIGGKLNSATTHGQLGKGEYLVAEADESDASFLFLQPMLAIVTNIDADHLENYEYDFEKLVQAFVEFIHRTPFYGIAVLCYDDNVIRRILSTLKRSFITYGFNENSDVQAYSIEQEKFLTHFKVKLNNPAHFEKAEFDIQLNLPGRHNVLNALAAISVGLELGISVDVIQEALSSFAGIGRRFQINGEVRTPEGSVLLIDDYGHHPREMRATIDAIRAGWKNRRLVVVFQPHRYTRTQALFDDFCMILCEVDVLCLTEVYAAGETIISGADGRALCAGVRVRGKINPVFVEDIHQLPEVLCNLIQDGDILLTLGAGNIGSVAQELPKKLEMHNL